MRYASLVVLSGVSLLGVSARAGAEGRGSTRPPAVYEKKDADGRLLFRIVFRSDGTLNHTAYTYAQGAARTAHEAELDQGHEPVRYQRETFDEDGRIVEREDTTFQGGHPEKTRTTFEYDAEGQQTSRTTVE